MSEIEVYGIDFEGCSISCRIEGPNGKQVHYAYRRMAELLMPDQFPCKTGPAPEVAKTEPKEEPKTEPQPQRARRQRAAEAPPKEEPKAAEPPQPEPEAVEEGQAPIQKEMDAPGPDLKREEPKAAKGPVPTLTAKDLEGVKQRRDIVRRCLAKGITSLEDVVAACVSIQTESPALRPFKDMLAAIKPAYEAVLMENGAKNS